ncbi:LysR substrate-binding domain-containing protein [Cognatishimia sp. MH4019]|uniref:LysR substrate-binding domain-containing protein n=1 Tax=Cognatishimia sp. MH4019 TaxID=2854030 RepID=UPI001CD67307|nr:LysR substrate-binding domain-containing protein [Cognatishimia sp. MH4019]
MSIILFRTLVAVAQTGSFRGAAAQVSVTDAAVGQQMRRLEDQLGVALFDRSEKTPRLNQLGKALVPKAQAVVAAYDTILDDLIGDPRMIGELTLGAVPSSIRGLIPQTAKRLMGLYPDLHMRVVPGLSPDLLEQVEQGVLDAAVLSAPARVTERLNWMPFYEEELVLLTAPSVTETDPRRILATQPYIRHTRKAAVGELAEAWLFAQGITVQDAMEMGSLENVVSMVAHDLGVSVVPNMCVPDASFAELRKLPLGPEAPSRVLGILTRADCSKLQLVQRLLEQLSAVAAGNPDR